MQKQDRPLCVDPKREVDGRGRGPRGEGLRWHKPRMRVRLMRAAERAEGALDGQTAPVCQEM